MNIVEIEEKWEQRRYELTKELFLKSYIPTDKKTFSSPSEYERAENAIKEAKVFIDKYRSKQGFNN